MWSALGRHGLAAGFGAQAQRSLGTFWPPAHLRFSIRLRQWAWKLSKLSHHPPFWHLLCNTWGIVTQKASAKRCKMWLGKSQRCTLLGHGHDREHPCGNSGSRIPSLTTMNGWVLFAFFFNCCKTDVAGTALHMRNGQLMNSANHSNHTSWMVSAVLDHSHSRTLIRQCCDHTLPPFLFIPLLPAPLSSFLTRFMMESVWKMKSQPGRTIPPPAWWNIPHHPWRT